ncbi:hypothetical protein EDD36DRAFT_494757 [Exophiala viscosa]|uniref:Uncharacterized protein n=1 Tax=Exophiala viscosa TaxID=2486360 RepID=A0AAN6IDY4_9EURO|nr:hypothetical protein EDD36DRAFT_494757 [Exophiala viscosa]
MFFLFLYFACALSQYTTTSLYYDPATTAALSYEYQTTRGTTTSLYYDPATTATSSYEYQTAPGTTSSSYSASFTQSGYPHDSSQYSDKSYPSAPTTDSTYSTPIVSTPTPTIQPTEDPPTPTTVPKPWYETTAGKWGLGAGGTSCCMCVIGFVTWCIKMRHRKGARKRYAKLTDKYGNNCHDVVNCGTCSTGYTGGGQGQPFLHDPCGTPINMTWQPQAPNGAWQDAA